MKQEKIVIWEKEEYRNSYAYDFLPFLMSYLHEDQEIRPCMLVVPGGGYGGVSPTEGEIVAKSFYENGYDVFVLTYTTNILRKEPLKLQPLKDISRAVRMIRKHADRYGTCPSQLAVCGFSAGGHLCASLCVHYKDIQDVNVEYDGISNRPDAAILSYPVITSGKYAHRGSFEELLGKDAEEKELEYMSLEKHVTKDTPPCFLWQTATDELVPVENSYLFAWACKDAGVPYAHHVFSDGIHGLSLADQDWLEENYGEPYTLDQVAQIVKAIREGKTEMPLEMADHLEKDYRLTKTEESPWTPEVKEQLQEVIKEVGIWPVLARQWLRKIWKNNL